MDAGGAFRPSWPLCSCRCLYKTGQFLSVQCRYILWLVLLCLFFFFFFSSHFNALLFVSVSVSLSIKPFSQQAYSVQTAGTTTISGEWDQTTIISFLQSEQAVFFPAIQAADSQQVVLLTLFGYLGLQCALRFFLVKRKKRCQADFSYDKLNWN